MINKTARLPFTVGIIFVLCVLSPGIGLAQDESGPYSQDFESGSYNECWFDPGWQVIEKDSGHVLSVQAGPENLWANPNVGPWNDFSLRFNVNLVGNSTLHANFRTGEEPSRYLIGLTQDNVYLVKQTSIEEFSFLLDNGEGIKNGWQSIEIIGHGPEIIIIVNEQVAMTYTDPEPLLHGGISFETLSESQVFIDDIEIREADSATSQAGESPLSEAPQAEVPLAGDQLSPDALTWVNLGGPPGGIGYDIRYNYDDPNVWYVTDANSGIYISDDNGLTWRQSNNGLGEFAPVFSLTVDPHDPQTIWIGMNGTGKIYKSIDGGLSWVEKDNGVIHEYEISLSFRGFTVDPRTSDIVYAMGELQEPGNNVWGLRVGGVIYKTEDGGENWTRIWDGGIPSSLTRYLWINPQNPDVLYVSTGIFDRGAVGETNPDTDPNPFGGLGVLKSIDGGKSWRVLNEENGLESLYIGSLYMHPEDPDILFAAAGRVLTDLAYQKFIRDNHSPFGIYRTVDGGESWVQILEPEKGFYWGAFCSVEICPSNPDILYAGSDMAIYRSLDGGDSWSRMAGSPNGWGPIGVRAGWPIDMQCAPRDPNRIFVNNYNGGNFLSEDGGETWINASTGYTGALMINVAVDPFDPAHVFAVGRSGVWQSFDAGITWTGIYNPQDNLTLGGGDWGGVAFDPVIQDHIILGGQEGFLEWRPDENRWGDYWAPANYYPETSEIEFAPSNPTVVYAASASHNSMVLDTVYEDGYGVVVSRDGGSTWKAITGEQFKDAIITDVSIDPTNANVVYVASQIGLFKSQDGGESWVSLSSLSGGKPVRTVGVSPQNPNKVFAGIQSDGFYISEDGGNSWRQIAAGLEPNGIHRDIIFDPTNPEIMYTSDILSGVYQSQDGGESWIKIVKGIEGDWVTSLSISSDGQHIYVTTSGAGVFRLDLNGQPP